MRGPVVWTVLIIAVLGWHGAAFAQQSAEVSDLIAKLHERDGDARQEAVKALSQFGAEVVDPLFETMDWADSTTALAARQAVTLLAHQAAADARGPAVAAEIARQMEKRKRVPVRRAALELLSFVGTESEAGRVADCLGSDALRDMAILALVRIPGSRAVTALTDALTDALQVGNDELAVALLLALGEKRDPSAFQTVRRCLDRPGEVSLAAIAALGRLPTPRGVEALGAAYGSGNPAQRRAASAALLALADALLERGDETAAGAAFRRVYSGATTEAERCAGLRGIARTSGRDALGLLLAALRSGPPDLAGTARAELAELELPGLTDDLAAALRSSEPSVGRALAWVLGQRGGPAAVAALLDTTRATDQGLRMAAYEALRELGDPAAGPELVAAVARETGALRDSAIAAMNRSGGEATINAILDRLSYPRASTPNEVRAAYLRSLGLRNDPRIAPLLLSEARDRDEVVRSAALAALADLKDPSSLQGLIALLDQADQEKVAAVRRVLEAMPQVQVVGACRRALSTAPERVLPVLIAVLGRYRDKECRDIFTRYAQSEAPDVAAAALVALSEVAAEADLTVLRSFARDARPAVRDAAVQGMLRVAGARHPQDEEALGIYREALALAARDEERAQALLGMARVPNLSSLDVLVPMLDSPGNLGTPLARALVPVADLVGKDDPDRALALYDRILGITQETAVLRQVSVALRTHGVDLDLAGDSGYVSGWWVTGPIDSREALRKADALAPAAVDVNKPVEYKGRAFPWSFHRVDDPAGLINLEIASARADNVGCYIYAEVVSPADMDARLRIGSDDDVVVWLNGKEVHRYIGDRGWTQDQDTVDVRLTAGTNAILCKVLQGGGQWSCSVRIVDRTGKPLVLEQVRPVNRTAMAGFVSSWWVAGPVGSRAELAERDAIDPSGPVIPREPISTAAGSVPWKVVVVDDPAGGMVDLAAAIGQQNDVGCYAYAEFMSDRSQDVTLQMGSDDDIVVWLNGREVHRFVGDRPWRADSDTARAHLQEGVNTILCKVLQGYGEWAFSVRVLDSAGDPVAVPPRPLSRRLP